MTTDRQTNKQTDRTKTICPRSFDPGAFVNWKGVISWVCMPNMKSRSLTVQKLQPRLKLTTDRQTNNEQTGQKQYAPTIRSGGIKTQKYIEFILLLHDLINNINIRLRKKLWCFNLFSVRYIRVLFQLPIRYKTQIPSCGTSKCFSCLWISTLVQLCTSYHRARRYLQIFLRSCIMTKHK